MKEWHRPQGVRRKGRKESAIKTADKAEKRRRTETTKNSKQEEADSSQLIAGIEIGERRCSDLDMFKSSQPYQTLRYSAYSANLAITIAVSSGLK
jgi:hypothetical protein